MLRRAILGVTMLTLLAVPGSALAAPSHVALAKKGPTPTWRTFKDKIMALTFRYPANWKLLASNVPGGTGQAAVSYQGAGNYSLSISILPIKSGVSLDETMRLFFQYERSIGNTSWTRATWTATTVGGRPARTTVIKPQTEGG